MHNDTFIMKCTCRRGTVKAGRKALVRRLATSHACTDGEIRAACACCCRHYSSTTPLTVPRPTKQTTAFACKYAATTRRSRHRHTAGQREGCTYVSQTRNKVADGSASRQVSITITLTPLGFPPSLSPSARPAGAN
jgi:hypothetical protein